MQIEQDKFDSSAAERYARLALAGIDREFPNKPAHVWHSEADCDSPSQLHPVFYGHFDWHSSVHAHWSLVRLLKLFPRSEWAAEIREVLEHRLTEDGLKAEAAYLEKNKSFERMYGWAWSLRLAQELRTWDDAQGRKWARHLEPLERIVVQNAKEYLPKLEWPIRCGFHPETAFPLAQFFDYSIAAGDSDFAALVTEKSKTFYFADVNYPVNYEPSGNDFFSPCLNVADLMRRILSPSGFALWLNNYLPELETLGLGNLLTPASISDLTDGHLVHLAGLNLSRAWTMQSIASALPKNDLRRETLCAAAEIHAQAGLSKVWSDSYEGEHWLGTFAVYLKSRVGHPNH